METSSLAIFVRAAELGSITRAADELGYTQSASSHILARLENGLGVRLLNRTRNGVVLTHAGQRLLPAAKAILAYEEELRYTAQILRQDIAGNLYVGSVTSITVQWLPEVIRRFTELHPKVEIRIRDGSYGDVERWLCEKKVDCGFLSSLTKENLRVIPLTEDPLLAVLPAGHRLAAMAEIPAEELQKEKILIPAEGTSYDVGDALKRAGIEVSASRDNIGDYSAITLVKMGYGITIMPQLLLKGYPLDGIVVRPLLPKLRRVVCLATANGQYVSPTAEAFVQFVLHWVEETETGIFGKTT